MSERLKKARAFNRSVELYGSALDRESVADILQRTDKGRHLENLQAVELAQLSAVVERILGVDGFRQAILNSFEWAKWETCIQGRDLGFRLTLGKEPFELSYFRTGDSANPPRPVGRIGFLSEQELLDWNLREGQISLSQCGVLPSTRQIGLFGTQIVREFDEGDIAIEYIGDYDSAIILTPTINSYRCEIIDDWPDVQERIEAFGLDSGGMNRSVNVDRDFQKKALARFLSGVIK